MKEKLVTIIYMEKGYTHLNKKWMFIWANGSQINFTVGVFIALVMGKGKFIIFSLLDMKGILKMDLNRARANIYIKMEIFIMAYGLETENMVRVYYITSTRLRYLNVHGITVKNKGSEFYITDVTKL